MPRLQTALNDRVVIEQATGFLREHLDITSDDAFTLLRRYAHTTGAHLTDIARTLIGDPHARPPLLVHITHFAADNTN